MNIYVGKDIGLPIRVIQMCTFIAYLNDDGTYDVFKDRYTGMTPKGVSGETILKYMEGISH